ncbi:MAG TPA: FUSC family protein [Hyphomicrobium sp.]|jgi:uncharacterized membrane protein YccC
MSTPIHAHSWRHHPFLFDTQRFLFSLSSYLACVLTLGIAFAADLPRPWWAILTVYVTAQPMSGALRPKALQRLIGILLGAVVAIVTVPNLQNSPELLVLCLASWTGLCIYLAVLDRTPRAYIFQMAGFSAAVISFPYLDDPGNIFTTTISRVEEMTLAIASVTLVHALLRPRSVKSIIYARAAAFLADATAWADGAVDSRHQGLTYAHRQRLASDVTELGIIAVHLPYDTAGGVNTRRLVHALQRRLAALIPLASATAQRLDLLGGRDHVAADLAALIDQVRDWLREPPNVPAGDDDTNGAALVSRARSLSKHYGHSSDWHELISASLAERMAEFIEAVRDARTLVRALDDKPINNQNLTLLERPPPMARDAGMAALAGFATAAAVILYCAVWILLAWPAGSATAAFAALITCSFAAQEDPAPIIRRYLFATLATFPIAAIYMFVVLPCIDGYGMLSVALAPALIGIGYIQADPARSGAALPMFSCLIVGLGFVATFQPDFAEFVNTGIAQVMGIVITIAVTRLFRSVGVIWSARRMIRAQWRELEALATARGEPDFGSWTALALDRTGQIAARLAFASEGDELHAADGLGDLRVGRNILHLRRAAEVARGTAAEAINKLLSEVANLFRIRHRDGIAIPAGASVLTALDGAMTAIQTMDNDALRHQALLATVGMRCNLFPAQAGPGMAAAA